MLFWATFWASVMERYARRLLYTPGMVLAWMPCRKTLDQSSGLMVMGICRAFVQA